MTRHCRLPIALPLPLMISLRHAISHAFSRPHRFLLKISMPAMLANRTGRGKQSDEGKREKVPSKLRAPWLVTESYRKRASVTTAWRHVQRYF